MQMLLFFFFCFSLLWILYRMIFLFLLNVLKNVTLCSLNVCVLIYLWFAKMMIWSMLQVLLREEKKLLLRCVCVMGKVDYFGGGFMEQRQTIIKPQDYNELFWRMSKWKQENSFTPLNSFLAPSTMSLLAHSPVGPAVYTDLVWLQPFVTDPGSVWPHVLNQTCQENLTCYQLLQAALFPSRLECLVKTKVLKSSKGERSLQDQTGMCNKSYSLFKLNWFGGFVSCLNQELHFDAF